MSNVSIELLKDRSLSRMASAIPVNTWFVGTIDGVHEEILFLRASEAVIDICNSQYAWEIDTHQNKDLKICNYHEINVEIKEI